MSRRRYYDKWIKAGGTRDISRLLARGMAILASVLCICGTSSAADVFDRGNLLAFNIIPFDTAHRTPIERRLWR